MADHSHKTAEPYIFKALLSGGVCAFVTAFLNPIDVTKIRMQNQNKVTSTTAEIKIC